MEAILTRGEGQRRGADEIDSPQPRPRSQHPTESKRRGAGERLGYALKLAYDGRGFAGFARQPGRRTIEGTLQAALAAIAPGLTELALSVAARTDAGVHARAQVVSFRVRLKLDPRALREALSEALPRDVLVLAAAAVGPTFHARNSSRERTYRYRLRLPNGAPIRPDRFRLLLPPLDHDWAAAQRFLCAQLGRQDRTAFTLRPLAPKQTELRQAEIQVRRGPCVTVTFRGDAFTRQLIRNWMAAALAVAQRRTPIPTSPAGFRGRPAPACGLCLWQVRYDDDPFTI